jgi:hypothetical protein
MKKRNELIFLVLISIIVVCLYIIYKQNQRYNSLVNSFPSLTKDERIKYFDLIEVNKEKSEAKMISESILSNKKPSVIFIFSRPCTPCEKNIVFWKKIQKILSNKIEVYGIVINTPSDAFDFVNKVELPFPIYIPKDRDKFINKFRLHWKVSQTIISIKKLVKYIKIGNLTSDDTKNLITNLKYGFYQ